MTNRAPLILAIVLLLLPVLYVGSYFALVVPGPPWHYDMDAKAMIFPDHYRLGGEWAKAVFWPLEQIDQRGRPVAWKGPNQLTPAEMKLLKARIRARKAVSAGGST